MVPLKITYDENADAAYIYFEPDGEGARVAKTYACNPVEVAGVINVDFDAAGRLLGVEVLDARSRLAPDLLAAATAITTHVATGERTPRLT